MSEALSEDQTKSCIGEGRVDSGARQPRPRIALGKPGAKPRGEGKLGGGGGGGGGESAESRKFLLFRELGARASHPNYPAATATALSFSYKEAQGHSNPIRLAFSTLAKHTMAVYDPTVYIISNILLYASFWQAIRTYIISSRTQEKPLKAFLGRPVVSTMDERNPIHNKLGMIHCTLTCVACAYQMYITWDQPWEELFYARSASADDSAKIHPVTPAFITFGYFLSDLTYIFDFRQWLWHHLFAMAALLCSMLRPSVAFVNVYGIFSAEIGGLLLNLYMTNKNIYTYSIFVLCYGLSRVGATYMIWKTTESAMLPEIGCERWIAAFMSLMGVAIGVINWG